MRSSILTQKRAKTLRRHLTQSEQTLWALLRRNNLGLHFRRQHAVGPFVLDFYCAGAKLCVEVDGPSLTIAPTPTSGGRHGSTSRASG